jgi:hypothetical protein
MSSKVVTKVEAKVYLELTEGEARALAAICAYGPRAFTDWFYANLGKTYLQPFVSHLQPLFDKAYGLKDAVKKIDAARQAIKEIEV